jgi:hypothetical protein
MKGKELELENKRIEDDSKNKVAEITKVEFLDEHGEIKNVFETGEDIVARIHYNAKKKIEKPVFGVAIHTNDGFHISGPNTKTSKFPIDFIDGNGFFDFIMNENQFFSGSYKFTAALYNWECLIPFDFKDKMYNFKVISRDENQSGLLKIKMSWKK